MGSKLIQGFVSSMGAGLITYCLVVFIFSPVIHKDEIVNILTRLGVDIISIVLGLLLFVMLFISFYRYQESMNVNKIKRKGE
jgi:hypothetical protein